MVFIICLLMIVLYHYRSDLFSKIPRPFGINMEMMCGSI